MLPKIRYNFLFPKLDDLDSAVTPNLRAPRLARRTRSFRERLPNLPIDTTRCKPLYNNLSELLSTASHSYHVLISEMSNEEDEETPDEMAAQEDEEGSDDQVEEEMIQSFD
jgi:hypothetical protein